MEPDEPRRRQLRGARGEGGGEGSLVVVVTVRGGVVFPAYIDDDGACRETRGVAGPKEGGVRVVGQQTEHGYSEGFVGVEGATDFEYQLVLV